MTKKISDLKLAIILFCTITIISSIGYASYFFSDANILCNVTDLYTNNVIQMNADELRATQYTQNVYVFFMKNLTQIEPKIISLDSMKVVCFMKK